MIYKMIVLAAKGLLDGATNAELLQGVPNADPAEDHRYVEALKGEIADAYGRAPWEDFMSLEHLPNPEEEHAEVKLCAKTFHDWYGPEALATFPTNYLNGQTERDAATMRSIVATADGARYVARVVPQVPNSLRGMAQYGFVFNDVTEVFARSTEQDMHTVFLRICAARGVETRMHRNGLMEIRGCRSTTAARTPGARPPPSTPATTTTTTTTAAAAAQQREDHPQETEPSRKKKNNQKERRRNQRDRESQDE